MNKIKCPACKEREIELLPVEGKPGRVQGFCICNERGAVLETDAAQTSSSKPGAIAVVEVKKE